MNRILSIATAVFTLTGCQTKLKDARTLDIEPGGINTVYVNGPRYDQKVTVDFTSSDAPVNVYVCLRKDERAVGAAADVGKPHEATLGSKQDAKSGIIEVSIPAKQEFAVLVFAVNKRTAVTMKIDGK